MARWQSGKPMQTSARWTLFEELSPPDLLNSREYFRRAPPPELPQAKYGEIEACFGGLITLYHIRKLLSSHGIRPAYEMLEEKLKQGPFARMMGRNESIRKVTVLMQRSLSHGAPSPKLSKMLQVLTDHFKTKDPQNSRVIIFSNFRGSVRDIMDALADIGDIVKATEFIGQSSAKQLKGQSQKVQQAVLQKFRAGGYNVIVATSIGEEGLDIMEVDLVICFDANVSPLRMIQRMGRTGRKHNGRVVVLACEGSELKGYMRKQANSRTIRKHMYNGGIHSFNFHPSPRMIPHIFKPEVQFVELSIEKYIPRGTKGKEDNVVQAFSFKEKLTSEERHLLAKYFQPTSKSTWRPSLIAFPHSQAFPSRVLKVMHSSRTDMLIDSMQHLQGLSRDGGAFSIEDEVSSDKSHGVHLFYEEDNHYLDQRVNFVDNEENLKGGCLALDDTSLTNEQIEATELELSQRTKKQCPLDPISHIPPAHSFLFNSDIVSIDALGRVHISCVPSLPFRHENSSGCTRGGKPLLVNHVEQNASSQKLSDQNCKVFTEVGEHAPKPSKLEAALGSAAVLDASRSSLAHVLEVEELDQVGTTPHVPHVKKNMLNEGGCTLEIHGVMEIKGTTLGDESSSKLRDGEMSPRLNNLILSGIVPESPANPNGNLCATGSDDCVTPEVSTFKCDVELLPKLPDVGISRKHGQMTSILERNLSSFTNKRLRIPSALDTVTESGQQQVLVSPVSAGTSSTKKSSCEDWFVNSADNSQNIEPVRKLKRLRKVGDNVKNNKNPVKSEKSLLPVVNLERRFSDKTDHSLFKSKKKNGVMDGLVEVEAEVSSDHEASSDEVCEGDSSYEDSFIDDLISPTAHSTQAESSRVNMLAVYRRSLLSQSPMPRELSSGTCTPNSSSVMSRTDRSGISSIKPSSSLRTSEINVELQERNSGALPFLANTSTHEHGSKFGIRKRKLSFVQLETTPCMDLEGPDASKSNIMEQKSVCRGPTDDMNASDDDQFFAGLDLDAVEEQAALVLQRRSETQKMGVDPKTDQQNFEHMSAPSFDLGIF